MVRDQQIARHAEIERRYRRRSKTGRKSSLSALRIRDLTKLYRARHGYQLPNDSIGRDCAGLMCQHLATLPDDPRKRITEWLQLWCPWISIADAQAMLAEAILKPKRWRADKLAWRLHLIDIDRTALRITTIGSIDVDKAQRTERRKARHRELAAQRRKAKGAKPRAQYLASIQADKPWIAAGISRATWYRRVRRGP